MEKQGGIYARYSLGRNRDQTSAIEVQVAMCREKAQREGVVWNRQIRTGIYCSLIGELNGPTKTSSHRLTVRLHANV